MGEKESENVSLAITIDGFLFGKLEKARMTERGRIPRNEFIRHAIAEQIERTKKGNQQG